MPKGLVKKHMGNQAMAFFFITIALLFFSIIIFGKQKRYLVFAGEDGTSYLEFAIKEGEEFSIEFIHSVNQSPVTDFYEARADGIYVTKTLYYDFGAGVQTSLEEGQVLSYTQDGGMLVSGFDKKIEGLSYVVGKVSDHVLRIKGQSYSLGNICGRGTLVNIFIR